MECTQRLECTQELNGSQLNQERTCPDQIGFLGICGSKYPVNKGPNKIGRDPQTCNIVLNLNSVSRQHAVINILNTTDYMIMDLDSANKTRLIDKILPPYIPHPLKNGDTVQFGQVFGVFRLLEEDNDLPMTQALDIPETPILNKYVSKINNFPTTTIPESPDVSDKDDSFIMPSQPKLREDYKSANSHFIKPGKTIAIQPVGTNKIDNIYWNSSKRSVSFEMQLDETDNSLVDSTVTRKSVETVTEQNIHEMETQVPFCATQNNVVDPIYTANTQIPANSTSSPDISNLETQLPTIDNLPDIQKVHNQLELKLDLFVDNKENNNSIYNADTQPFPAKLECKEKNLCVNSDISVGLKENVVDKPKSNLNISDEEIIFEEINSQQLQDEFESQPLLLPEILVEETSMNVAEESILSDTNKNQTTTKREEPLSSDNSTDCEDFDMLPTQKILEKPDNTLSNCEDIVTTYKPEISKKLKADDESTDCEDQDLEIKDKKNKISNIMPLDDDSTDCEDDILPCNSDALKRDVTTRISFEDLATQVIATKPSDETNDIVKSAESELKFEEMSTQIIQVVNVQNESSYISKCASECYFEDLPTQVLETDTTENVSKQCTMSPDKSPFKVPVHSIKKVKRKVVSISEMNKTVPKMLNMENETTDNDNFYEATQDLFNDLCSQKEPNLDIGRTITSNNDNGTKLQINVKPDKNKSMLVINSSESSDGDDKINKFVTNLSNAQIKDIIGVEKPNVLTSQKVPSDNSDIDSTPKKLRPFRLMETELPNSQEIKTSVSISSRKSITETSSDSEAENDSEEQYTPILFHKNKIKKNAKIDLTKKFEVEKLPTRIITRVRKPTAKVQNTISETNHGKNFLQPRFITEQEENIDNDIICENISRLKSKTDKHKNDRDYNKSSETKNELLQSVPETYVHTNDKIKSDQVSKSNNTQKIRASTKRGKVKTNEPKKHGKDKAKDDKNDMPKESKKSSSRKEIEIEKNSLTKVVEKNYTKLQKNANEVVLQSGNSKSEQICQDGRNRKSSRGSDTKPKNNENITKSKCVNDKHDTENESNVKRTAEEQKSTRRSRNKHKDSDGKKGNESADREIKTEIKISIKGDRRKRNQDKSKDESSPEIEIRRSKRQRTAKNDLDTNLKTTESTSKKNKLEKHEHSTIYSISSESGIDSPKDKNCKRPAKDDFIRNVKRTRSVTNSDSSTILRATPRNIKTHRVLFTAFPCEEVKAKLEKLGAVIVSDVKECTVLLTLQIKRTFKLLCAVGLGRPIVGPSWVQACVDTNMIVDPWLYLIKDEATERRFQFNLERTLVGKRDFLKGYNVSSTPSVMPSAMEMRLIVECSGGTWREEGARWVCVSCGADRSLWPALKRRGAAVVSTEFILGGVLKQKLDIDRNKLA